MINHEVRNRLAKLKGKVTIAPKSPSKSPLQLYVNKEAIRKLLQGAEGELVSLAFNLIEYDFFEEKINQKKKGQKSQKSEELKRPISEILNNAYNLCWLELAKKGGEAKMTTEELNGLKKAGENLKEAVDEASTEEEKLQHRIKHHGYKLLMLVRAAKRDEFFFHIASGICGPHTKPIPEEFIKLMQTDLSDEEFRAGAYAFLTGFLQE